MAAAASALRSYQRDAGDHTTAADLAHFVAWLFEQDDADDEVVTDVVAHEESKELEISAEPEAALPVAAPAAAQRSTELPLGTPMPRERRTPSGGLDAFTSRPRRSPQGADLFASTPPPRATRGVFDAFAATPTPGSTTESTPVTPTDEPPPPRRWPW
jgi:hypothetical protein